MAEIDFSKLYLEGDQKKITATKRDGVGSVLGHIPGWRRAEYFNRARNAFLERRGLALPVIETTYDLRAMVRTERLEYSNEINVGDKLLLYTGLNSLGNSSMDLLLVIAGVSDNNLTWNVTRYVFSKNGQSVRIPNEVRGRLPSPMGIVLPPPR